ncbi:Lysine-arginine-ornithine-binding periplasmic protein precursor [Pseudomonas sp. XWY-1]|uniref:lysine/arginine/ornithine ABC transporter substrate-binding protein n=1 Tax=Pseudomonas TaxID=286 RepID=UPI000CDC47EC|nr:MULTISPECIES: lysine/arginine/ornithine ABC transporter substrate-binding protein [Pseudomonas]AUZ58559.1 Lysine-arginine-ornithine-binding periplasmic protein precursor [Pseudomonas sp. XWY-1]MDD2146757.1 lysine/arginine/ornithine ABC transporter substrate-binding protein [Pseudomonas putida]UVL87079.1 lysine/arginine/ornithine ABC transporter substrate-binding protein [Pseudomonas sichuanensis]HDS1705594.1 transporter substrate-binding domain-containing protein [Pseudomonas putida]
MNSSKYLACVALALSTLFGAGAHAEQKSLRIATEGTYPPFSYLENGQLSGFDVDIAKALCERIQARCEIVSQGWDGMIPGLMSGKYDAVVASMAITEERKQKIDFTDKYYATPARFIAEKNAGITDTSVAGMAGKVIGVQGSTTQGSYLEDFYKDSEIKVYKTVDDAAMDLSNGRLDAVFSDSAILYPWLQTSIGACCDFVGQEVRDDKYFGVGKGIGVRKEDQALRVELDTAIKSLLADGTYQRINQKYFPFAIY